MPESKGNDELIEAADAAHGRACSAHGELLGLILEIDLSGAWEDSGARDCTHWVSMRYGISYWKAQRWIRAAHAMEGLPLVAESLACGELGMDKVVELTRFATLQTEADLIAWAKRVSCGRIRERGDQHHRSLQEAQQAEQGRRLEWWYFSEDARFGLSAELPAAEGAVVARALERLAESLPVLPGEQGEEGIDARRADALVALCLARNASDPDPNRATLIIHARLDQVSPHQSDQVLDGDLHRAEIEGGPAIHPQVARRVGCHARVQVVLEDGSGQPLRVGRMRREPPEWMIRQLRYRDSECTFPSCGHRRYTQAHHVAWWTRGGRTDLDNLVLVCSFHHKLVHEFGWSLRRLSTGEVRWFHPDGTRYRAGPAPPGRTIELRERHEALLAAAL